MKSAHHAPNPGISRVCKKKKKVRQNIQLLQEQTDFTVKTYSCYRSRQTLPSDCF